MLKLGLRFLFFLYAIFTGLIVHAQEWKLLEENPPYYTRYEINTLKEEWTNLPTIPFTSFVIRAHDLSQIQLQNSNGVMQLIEDSHSPDLPHQKQSIQIFRVDEEEFKLKAKPGSTLELLLFYAPKLTYIANQYKFKSGRCDEPDAVPQSSWRAGLPAPTATPAFTQVNHLIIHHSAGTSPTGDATQTIRDIYLLHTQGNGWDDIGYNYLVSANGTLFKGRDPQGLGKQDEVRGAHYCGKNSNTMGICLLGDFMQNTPSDTMLGTLQNLLVWKYFIENHNPLGQTLHPIGDPNAVLLNHLDGHRRGCATDCPGDKVFSRLPNIRDAVYADYLSCKSNNLEEKNIGKQVDLRHTPNGVILYNHTELDGKYEVIDLQGRIVYKSGLSTETNKLPSLNNGMFVIKVEVGENILKFKLAGLH